MTQPRLLGERYELGPLIGYGGMAEVHKGRDIRLGREVAIKVLRADLARDPSFQARFGREAQSSAGLNHPSIVAVYDTGEDHAAAGSVPYIVMEYVEGKTLREVLNTEQRLSAQRAMEIVAEVCAALDYSHRNGIVHRDIKPGNVMITRAGAVKVMDFGIARALADNGATVTQTAAVIGTAQYLSPEQARGESVDARSDVYSAGCLLYELLTGSPPFTGDSPVAVAYQHVRENAAPPSSLEPSVPRTLDAVVMKALAKNPLNRYQTAAEMRADIQRVLADQPVIAETVMSDEERTQYIGRAAAPGAAALAATRHSPAYAGEPIIGDDRDDDRNGWRIAAWIAGIAALIALIAVAGFLLLRGSGSDDPEPPAQQRVPLLENMDQTTAQQTLARYNLKLDPNTATAPSDTIAAGRIISQSPTADTLVDEGTAIRITLSSGRQLVAVPNLVGLTVEQANAKMNEAGLALHQQSIDQASGAGTVISQDPPAQTQVEPGTTVTVQVPSGRVAIPDVRGLSYEDARAVLNQSGFFNVSSSAITTSDSSKVGTVINMNPAQDALATTDTKIVLEVGQAAPTQTPTPTTTPPTSTPPRGSSGAGTGTGTGTSTPTGG